MAQTTAGIAARKGSEVALVDEVGETTWAQFDERVNRLIHALRAEGLAVGDTIALMVGNRREFFEVTVAAMHTGLIVVPVNWHWVADELAYVIDDSDAKALIVDGRFLEVAVDAVDGTHEHNTDRCPLRIVVAERAPAGFVPYEAFLAAGSADEPVEQTTGGPMFYTSGTTGFPKGVRGALSTTGLDPVLIPLIIDTINGLLQIPADGVTLLLSLIHI